MTTLTKSLCFVKYIRRGITPLLSSVNSSQASTKQTLTVPLYISESRGLRTWPTLCRSASTKSPNRNQRKTQVEEEVDSDSDSDSEGELYSHRGESEFWRRKMRTFHSLLDVNKDGVVSFDDFILLTDRFTDLGHMTDYHSAKFKLYMKEIWEIQYGPVDKYNLLTTEQFLEEMHHALNDSSQRKQMHKFLPYLFKALDKDQTGEITVEEFKLFFKCLGLNNEAAVLSFNTIDENADGKLTLKEFVSHGKEFFLSEDDTKCSKWFWGPLIQH